MDLKFERAIKDTVLRLSSVELAKDGAFISTSGLYPSGAYVTVRATFDGHSCFVSDMGAAAHEAEMLGATSRVFQNQGRAVASEFGIGFDSNSFFTLEVSLDRLEGAVRVVSTASLQAAILTDRRVSEQAERNDKLLLIERLYSVFGEKHVDTDVDIFGSSGHLWNVTAQTMLKKDPVLFDVSSTAYQSISSVHTKFHDILLREDMPTAVVAVSDLKSLKSDYRNLLQQSANVIQIDASDETYRKLARAA